MYSDWKKVSHMSAAELRELQNKKIRWFFSHKLPYAPFYRAHFEKHGLKFSDIRTIEDLRKIPLISF